MIAHDDTYLIWSHEHRLWWGRGMRGYVERRSCPTAWCRSDAPQRAVPRRQVAATGRLTAGVSLTAVMVSSVM
jgi:hypothetical protein